MKPIRTPEDYKDYKDYQADSAVSADDSHEIIGQSLKFGDLRYERTGTWEDGTPRYSAEWNNVWNDLYNHEESQPEEASFVAKSAASRVAEIISEEERARDQEAQRLYDDVMQQRAKMAITHSNAKLEQKWREHVNGAEIREYRKAKGQGE